MRRHDVGTYSGGEPDKFNVIANLNQAIVGAETDMPRIRIRDLTEQGLLAFDLADLLDVLGDSARTSSWKCSVEWCTPVQDARPYLETACNTPEAITGTELFALARETRQVIDGAFEAFGGAEETPWITLEAIDSSYWDVFAHDSLDLSRFESHFRKVERIDS